MVGPHFRPKSLPWGADTPLKVAWENERAAQENAVHQITAKNRVAQMLGELDQDPTGAAAKIAEIRATLESLVPMVEEAKALVDVADDLLARELARFQARRLPASVQEEAADAILEVSRSAEVRVKAETAPIMSLMTSELSAFVDRLAAIEEKDRPSITQDFSRAETQRRRRLRAARASVRARFEEELKARLAEIRQSARRQER